MARRPAENADFDHPVVAVDLVLMTILPGEPRGRLAALLMRRDGEGRARQWALPGAFVANHESLDTAAERVLRERARVRDARIEQLYSFGDVGRDPRFRVVTVAYFALLPPERFPAAGDGLALATVDIPWRGEKGGPVAARGADGKTLPLAFDHAEILGLAVKRLRGKLDWSDVAFGFLPQRFTLRALQDVHEAILDKPLNKPAFRRRLLDSRTIEATGAHETGASFRPAELYRQRSNALGRGE